jgi:hypothetical protein
VKSPEVSYRGLGFNLELQPIHILVFKL